MQKYHEKHDNMHYITKNCVLKPIYNDEMNASMTLYQLLSLKGDLDVLDFRFTLLSTHLVPLIHIIHCIHLDLPLYGLTPFSLFTWLFMNKVKIL